MYNLTKQQQSYGFVPADIPELNLAEKYWVFDFFQRKAFSLGREERYENTVAQDGYAWFVILPQGRNITCLGLADKYAGFTAVESIIETEEMDICVVHESGTLGWISEKEPQKVIVNGRDVTEVVQREETLYTLVLPEEQQKIVLSIIW